MLFKIHPISKQTAKRIRQLCRRYNSKAEEIEEKALEYLMFTNSYEYPSYEYLKLIVLWAARDILRQAPLADSIDDPNQCIEIFADFGEDDIINRIDRQGRLDKIAEDYGPRARKAVELFAEGYTIAAIAHQLRMHKKDVGQLLNDLAASTGNSRV